MAPLERLQQAHGRPGFDSRQPMLKPSLDILVVSMRKKDSFDGSG
jgi:hypothetical protein